MEKDIGQAQLSKGRGWNFPLLVVELLLIHGAAIVVISRHGQFLVGQQNGWFLLSALVVVGIALTYHLVSVWQIKQGASEEIANEAQRGSFNSGIYSALLIVGIGLLLNHLK